MGDDNECNSIDLDGNDIWRIDITADDNPNSNLRRYHWNDHLVVETAAANGDSISIPNNTQSFQTTTGSTSSYTSKKPLWWKRQSGRKISSRQRHAIQEVQNLGLQLKLPATTTKNDSLIQNIIRYDNNNINDNQSAEVHNDSLQLPAPIGKIRPQIDWESVFPTYHYMSGDEIWLEIGFGLGDNLLCLAASSSPTADLDMNGVINNNNNKEDPHTTIRKFFVGAEMHKGGVGTICTRIQSANHERIYWKDYALFDSSCITSFTENLNYSSVSEATILLYSNIRLHMGDGIKLLHFIPNNSLSTILITFPDPFMGTNQSSYRILQLDVLDQIRRVLISPEKVVTSEEGESTHNSTLIARPGRLYLATDHFGYHEWSHDQVRKFNNQKNLKKEEETTYIKLPSMMIDDKKVHLKKTRETFKLVEPTPERSLWLPVVSKYEQKGYDEGRKTYLSCWEAI